MRVLVTGASGFIGGHVTRVLRDRGHEVACLVRPTSNRENLASLGVEFQIGDITKPDSLPAAVTGVDVVIHLASLLKMPWDRAFHVVNAQGTGNLAAACAAAQTPPALVVVSSLAAAGPAAPGGFRFETDGAEPVSIYGRVKRDAELAALAFSDRLPISVARPPMVFGPGDRAVLKAFRSVQRGVHVVPGYTDRRVSMIHVEDLANGLVALAARGERAQPDDDAAGVYYLADPTPHTYAQFGRHIATALGTKTRVVHVPELAMKVAAAAAEGVARLRNQPSVLNLDKFREATAGDWVCAPDKARAQLGFACGPLETRLSETASWYRTAGWL